MENFDFQLERPTEEVLTWCCKGQCPVKLPRLLGPSDATWSNSDSNETCIRIQQVCPLAFGSQQLLEHNDAAFQTSSVCALIGLQNHTNMQL